MMSKLKTGIDKITLDVLVGSVRAAGEEQETTREWAKGYFKIINDEYKRINDALEVYRTFSRWGREIGARFDWNWLNIMVSSSLSPKQPYRTSYMVRTHTWTDHNVLIRVVLI
jgi:hypothetical protein